MIDILIVCECKRVNVPAYSTVSQEVLHAPLCHPTGDCQPSACMCVYLCGCVREWKRGLSLCVKRRACEHCRPPRCSLQPIRVSVCVPSSMSVWVCVCVHSGVHVSDWGKKRSCQVRLWQWPHKATKGSWKFTAFCHESSLDGAPANHRVSLGAGKYRK